jgi:hypothetical protein
MTTEIFEEIPLLMKGPLVLATLADNKTMTRRFITQRNSLIDGCIPTKQWWAELDWSKPEAIRTDPGPSPAGNPGPYLHVPNVDGDRWHRVYPRVQPGTKIWVRETWAAPHSMDGHKPRFIPQGTRIHYAASEPLGGLLVRPSIFMPRWACRLNLDTTKVRVERLQDISEQDAIAEGVEREELIINGISQGTFYQDYQINTDDICEWYGNPRDSFKSLWEFINGPGSWAINHWLWVYEFRRLSPEFPFKNEFGN